MASDTVTSNMKNDADDIERWARQIRDLTADETVKQLAERIRRTARDIFD